MRSIALVLLTLALALGAPQIGRAQTPPDAGFTLLPEPAADPQVTEHGYFVYELAPQSEAAGAVLVRNTGAEPIEVSLAALDAMTSQTGGSAFVALGTPPAGVARWIVFERDSVAVAPGEQQRVGFKVLTPATARPGQYLAGIAAYIPKPAEAGGNTATGNQLGGVVVTQTRYIVGVQVDVPGVWTPSLAVTGVEVLTYPSGSFLGVRLKNDGGTFLHPAGRIVLRDAAGKALLEQPIAMGTFVTGTEVTYPVPWPGAPAAGAYQAEIELDYGAGQPLVSTQALEISPEVSAGSAEVQREAQQAAAQSPLGAVPPWAIYGVGALLLLVAGLQVAMMARGRARR